MATQTKIITPDGKEGTGYIIGGQTFKDAAGTQRIDAGTKVYTNGGEYTYKGNNTSVPYHETTYHDAYGKVKPAYIRNGTAYTDKGLTTPVANGSVVKTQGGDFYKNPQTGNGVQVHKANSGENSFEYGGVNYQYFTDDKGVAYVDPYRTVRAPDGATLTSNGLTYVNSHSQGVLPTLNTLAQTYGKDSGVAESIRAGYDAQQKAIEARKKARIAEINARRTALDEEYEKNNRASYNAYLQSINPYGANAERLASLGLSDSGYAETTMARMASDYQKAIAENGIARANALLELELAIDEAYANGDEQSAEALAQMYSELASYESAVEKTRAEYAMQAVDAYNSDIWAQKQFDEGVRQFDVEQDFKMESLAQGNARKTAETVMAYLNAGYSISELAKMTGISENTLRAILQQYYNV